MAAIGEDLSKGIKTGSAGYKRDIVEGTRAKRTADQRRSVRLRRDCTVAEINNDR